MDMIKEWFGSENYANRLERIRRFWDGEERFMITVNSSQSRYRQVFDNSKTLDLLKKNLEAQSKLPGCNLPTVFSDFGTVSTAKYWGGNTFFPHEDSDDIFINPMVQTIEEALALPHLPPDAPDMDAARGIDIFKKACKMLDTDDLWLRTPDMQGPLNTAGLVMNQEEMMMAMYADPDLVHKFLDKTTDFLISYAQYLRKETNNRICGNLWPYTFFPCELGISLTQDFMPLLSAELYLKFGIPCLEKFSEVFGGLLIHCCGDWGRHAENLANSKADIKAIEFHHPFTKFEELEPLWKDTVFIPYLTSLNKEEVQFKTATEYYEHLLSSTDKSVRFWFAFPEDTPEAVEFAIKHGF